MYAADPTPVRSRTDRATCQSCEASPAGCESIHWLRGQWCCPRCSGCHDDRSSE